MTAKKKITDNNGVQVFPITHTRAVVDDNGNSVEQRLQENLDLINQKQLEVGAVPSDLTPTAGSSNWVTSGGIKSALIDITGITSNYVSGKYLNANGVVSADSGWCYCTTHIPVSQGDTVTYKAGVEKAGRYMVIFNSEGTALQHLEARVAARTLTVESASASYLMFSFALSAKDVAYAKVNDGNKYIAIDAQHGIVQDIEESISECDAKIDLKDTNLRNEIGLPDVPTYYDLFESGTIEISNSGWNYVNHSTRIRTKEGLTLHLNAGDIVGLKTYVSGQTFYIGYRKENGSYGTPGSWQTNDYTCPYTGDYVMTWNPGSSYMENLTDFFFIKSNNTINEIRRINTGRGRGSNEYYGKPIDLSCRQINRCIEYISLEHYFSGDGKITMWNQSMAMHNAHFFLFLDGTARTTTGVNCDVVVIYNYEIVFKGLMPSECSSHMNNAQFLNVYYNSNDTYPLLLLSRGDYGGNKANKAYVIRITETTDNDETTYDFTIVKTITLTGVPQVNYNGSWVCDTVNNKLYMYSMSNGYWNVTTNNWFVVHEFNMPNFLADGDISLTANDVTKRMDFDYMVPQGAASWGGKLFIGVQNYTKINGATPLYYKEHVVAVINPSTGQIETLVPTSALENEGVCIYNQLLYVSSKNGSADENTTNPCFNIRRYRF